MTGYSVSTSYVGQHLIPAQTTSPSYSTHRQKVLTEGDITAIPQGTALIWDGPTWGSSASACTGNQAFGRPPLNKPSTQRSGPWTAGHELTGSGCSCTNEPGCKNLALSIGPRARTVSTGGD